jgi:hypothetical protein
MNGRDLSQLVQRGRGVLAVVEIGRVGAQPGVVGIDAQAPRGGAIDASGG